jgi:hypothetical protein
LYYSSRLITFEELKVHEVPPTQFWWVFIILPLFYKSFELADVLPIATVLNNNTAIDANAIVVDFMPIPSIDIPRVVYLRCLTTIAKNIG